MAGQALAKKQLLAMDRQRKILEYLRDDPSLTNAQLAKILGTSANVISKDLRILSEEFKETNASTWHLHRDRLLQEIRSNKAECMRRLRNLGDSHGSRWMEEWTKLTLQEMRILNLGTSDTLTIEKGQSFDKHEQDAAIAALMKTGGFEDAEFSDASDDETKLLPPPEEPKKSFDKLHVDDNIVAAIKVSRKKNLNSLTTAIMDAAGFVK